VTNTNAEIHIKDCIFISDCTHYGSLISSISNKVFGNSNNRSEVDLYLYGPNIRIVGNIFVAMSSINIYLKNKVKYVGSINHNNYAKDVNIYIEKNSSFTLTGDSYVNIKSNYGEIIKNNYEIYEPTEENENIIYWEPKLGNIDVEKTKKKKKKEVECWKSYHI